MSDIRETLEAELRALERSLGDDPRFQKINALKSLLNLYEPQPPTERKVTAVTARAFSNSGSAAHIANNSSGTSRRTNPDRERALAAAAEYIKGRPYPTKTSEILEHLEKLGIPVAGSVPLSNLSAMLHHSPLFHTHGRKGWTPANSGDVEDDVFADPVDPEPWEDRDEDWDIA